MKKFWTIFATLACLFTLLLPVSAEEEELEIPKIKGEYDVLEDLTPYGFRTYESVQDSDAQPFGYGGPVVVHWNAKTDMDNFRHHYTDGVKIGCIDSRYLSRFATDYKIDKAYTNFVGTLAIHVLELNTPIQYYVEILGDGKPLYTSPVLTNETEPFEFWADLTDVTKLTIQAVAIDDSNQFYNYESIGLVKTKLELSPSKPTTPENPTDPENPENPEIPTQPEQPAIPTEPTEPVLPEDLDCSDWAKDELAEALNLGLVPTHLHQNYTENISRENFCHLVLQTLSIKNPDLWTEHSVDANNIPFADTKNPWVSVAYQMGIVNGTSQTTFEPNNSITRQEAAAMLSRAAGLLEIEMETMPKLFADQSDFDGWAVAPIGFVSATGIMEGTGENHFSPFEPYTLEQSILTALRMFKLA